MDTVTNATPTADDTQELPRLVLHTRPIKASELIDLTKLDGSLCAYRLEGIGQWIMGHIILVAVAKGNRVMALFLPVPRKDMRLQAKWRELSEIRFAWYAPAEEC